MSRTFFLLTVLTTTALAPEVTLGPVDVAFGTTNTSVAAESYTSKDVSASYPWKRWIFTHRGRNLLDENYEPVAGTTMRRLADPLSAELSAKVHL